jgi:hypothetical protein
VFNSFGEVNWLAVLVCAILSMVIGFIWYGPLFSKPWGRMTGWTNEKVAALPKSSMTIGYVKAFLFAFIIASVLALTLLSIKADGIGDGVTAAIVLWAGFTGATIGVNMTFERRPISLFGIEAGYHLLTLIAYAIVLSIW